VPLRAVKAHPCGAIITNKDLLLHDGAFMYVRYAHPFLLPATAIYYGLDISLTLFPLKGDGNFFFWIVFVVELIALPDVQTKLQLLKFAERVYTKNVHRRISHRQV